MSSNGTCRSWIARPRRGEIESEYELPDARLGWVGEHTVAVAGSMSVGEFNESTGAELPSGGARTLAGLGFDSLGRGDIEGDTVEVASVTLRVVEIDGARITRIRAELPERRGAGR